MRKIVDDSTEIKAKDIALGLFLSAGLWAFAYFGCLLDSAHRGSL